MRCSGGLLALGLGAALAGCRGAERVEAGPAPSASAGPAHTAADCDPRVTEKLGVPFSKLCSPDLPGLGVDFAPFWIAAQPLSCSAGEHETIRCPDVTPLNQPAPGETRAPLPAPSTLAAVVEANLAQSWCYMRFAGRLPTREERVRAELALGLTAVTVTHSGSDPLHFGLGRIAEWVTEEPCDAPTVSKCRVGMHPSGERSAIPWDGLVACAATPLVADAGLPLVALGESCPAPGLELGVGPSRLPCGIRSAAERALLPGFALDCRAVPPGGRHPPDEPATTAAVRCVMPAMMR
ncbi:MAG: hypothetical protein IT376_12595 [Polyangiaceae bacterium]|nr:hypothetical protein [Polyangiaceae bacterium]